jgi:Domain of unknown function (DUF4157)
MVLKLPKKPIDQARAQVQYPRIVSEFDGHPHHDFDFVHHPHYDNQPNPNATPRKGKDGRSYGAQPIGFENRTRYARPMTPEQRVAAGLPADPKDFFTRHLSGEIRPSRPLPKRPEPLKPGETLYGRLQAANLERKRQLQLLEQKPEINLESQQETPNLEQTAFLEQRKTSILSGFKKTSSLFSEEPKHVLKAKELQTKYESRASERLEQKADAHMEGLRRPDFDVQTNPLAAISEHFITKSNQNVPTRAFEREQHIVQAVRPAPANLIRTARASGFKTNQLTSAIQRFTDPTANKTVRTGIMTALHNSPSLSLEVQRSLEASDASLEVQRQAFMSEARETENNSSLSDRISQELNGGQPLEENVRKQLEAHFNTDLSKVRVHTDGKAHELAKSANAIAFTTGKNIFFQSGKYDPNSSAGFELLSHEVTHTIQQEQGLVSPGVDASSSLEQQAKLEGQKAVGNKGNLEKQANNFNDFLLKPNPENQTPVSRVQADVKNIQRSLAPSFVLQRDPAKAGTKTSKDEPKGTKLNLRGAAFNEKDPVKLRSSMDSLSKTNIVSKIPFGTTFLITEQISSWYRIKLDSGATGFVAGENISVSPEAKATFYKIKPGDNALDIASKHYNGVKGLDLRFYVGVLAKLNPKSIKMPDGIDWSKDSSVSAWKQANPMTGFFIWIPSQAYAANLKGSINNGKVSDHPLEYAADIGKSIAKKTIKDMGGDEVIKTLESIGQNVQLIWDNPGAFMENLQKSFSQGFGNFQAHFGEHLQTGVMQWLQSALGASFDIPKKADAAGLLSVGLQVVGLDYNKNLRPMLASSLPGGGLAALEGSGGVLQDVLKTGSLTPVIQMVQSREKAFESMLSGLPNMIITSLKDFAIKAIVTAGIKKMLTMLVPGGGLVQAAINIYNAITFFMDRAKQIGAFVQNLTSSFASIAKGDIKGAVKTIEAVLGSGLSLALGFLASAAGLTKIAASIKTALDKIQKPALTILTKIKDWIVKMFSSLVKKVTPGGKPSTVPVSSAKPTTQKPATPSTATVADGLVTTKIQIDGDVTPHQVWAEIKGGQPIMMMASTPKEIIAHLKDFKADARQKLNPNSPEFKTVSDQISASGKDVGKGIAEMRNVLKVTNPRASNTSDKVKTLPASKVAGSADLSKIAVNTLTSVKKHMEIAFPILNHAGVTVDNLKQAVSLAGGIVKFMKDIAGGKTLSGIDRKKLGELWNLKTGGKVEHREALKNLFRAAMPGHHEWIPSNLMLEVVDRDMDANKIGQVPEWIELQHKFRANTQKTVFNPTYAKAEDYRGKTYAIFQGHVGSIYLAQRDNRGVLKHVEQTKSQAEFHNELRDEFRKSVDKKSALIGIEKIITKWLWNGNSMPSTPIHPMLRWKDGGTFVDVSQNPGLGNFKSTFASEYKTLLNSINTL